MRIDYVPAHVLQASPALFEPRNPLSQSAKRVGRRGSTYNLTKLSAIGIQRIYWVKSSGCVEETRAGTVSAAPRLTGGEVLAVPRNVYGHFEKATRKREEEAMAGVFGVWLLKSRPELGKASGRMGRVRGFQNHRFPDWFDPTPIDFRPKSIGPFPESYVLTEARDVSLVPVPGHTAGQLAVIVEEEGGRSIFIAGDSSYTEELMLRGAVDGVAPDEGAARLTLERLRAYAAATPTVYLPSHDPASAARLSDRRVVVPVGAEVIA